MDKLDLLQEKIKYQFSDIKLLRQALMHSSYANQNHLEKWKNNERNEFLGDAVLELVSSRFIFEQNPTMPEGEMTKLRASLVCEPTLAFCAREIDLGEYIMLSKGEKISGGAERDSILSDALEALIGSIYLDSGYESAKSFILSFILTNLEEKRHFYDSKTSLQELVQQNEGNVLSYELLEENGPDHNKNFVVAAVINGRQFGVGSGKSKKSAEQKAAYETIKLLRQENQNVFKEH